MLHQKVLYTMVYVDYSVIINNDSYNVRKYSYKKTNQKTNKQ